MSDFFTPSRKTRRSATVGSSGGSVVEDGAGDIGVIGGSGSGCSRGRVESDFYFPFFACRSFP